MKGKPQGLNGIMVFKANNVDIENLTVCNFLGGAGDAGNEVWWNGANGSGKIGGHGMWGSYLSATSTFYNSEHTAAQYGIFSSNWNGGEWIHTYTSNFNDSGYYIGACQDQCDQTINDAWAQYNALGYSGTNSGGSLLVENSQFDHNEEGFDTNSQNNDDWPSPQNGACPAGVGSAGCGRSELLGVLQELRPRQQQPRRAVGGCRGRRPGGDRHDDLRGTQRHDHGQPLRQQRRMGGGVRALPRYRDAAVGRDPLRRRHTELLDHAVRPAGGHPVLLRGLERRHDR